MNKHQADAMQKILKAIPEITLCEVQPSASCCGAGGMQLLTPNKSNLALAQQKVDNILQAKPNIIVSANIGCSIQLKNTLQEAGANIELIHPLTLLAQQAQDL